MRVLVTGGLGFIGSNLIRLLLNKHRDLKIINLDNLSYGSNPENLRDIEGDPGYTFIKGDIRDFKLVSNLIKGVGAVINSAAETHVDRSISNPRVFLESNALGLFNILEAMRLYNPDARLIQVSSDEVYGSILNGSFKEDDRLNPSSPYSASKASADLFCIAYHRTYGLDVIVTRCTNNFGPYQFPEKLIPKTIIRASLGLKVPIYGTGRNVRDWIYVLDHCEALDFLMEKGRGGEVYNISSGNEVENIKLVKMILGMMGKGEGLIEPVEDRPGHDVRYSLDSGKIRSLGWKPRHDFDKAVRMTVDWYLENEWWWRPLAKEDILHPTPWKLRW